MNVNGLTPIEPVRATEPTNTSRTKKASETRGADRVSVGRYDQTRSVQILVDRSLARILEATQAAAKEAGIDLATFDPSPEAVSGRIADFAIGLFGLYRRQNPEMDDEEALLAYKDLINNAVDTGYREALTILSGLGVNDKNVLSVAEKTIRMTHDKFNHFIEENLKLVRDQNALADEPPESPGEG